MYKRVFFFKKAIFSICVLFAVSLSSSPTHVDIVYTWVDGSDPEWKKIKNHYLDIVNQEEPVALDSSADSRFNDHQELKYSLRSIWHYAPFINHIYIITMGQRPHWLKDHEKISIVDHKDIFLDQDHLPTFNSQAIEAHLHRIKDLKEHFIYFNDDVFLGGTVSIQDFFADDDRPYVFLEPHLSPKGIAQAPETVYRQCWRNNNELLDALYGDTPRFRLCHAPFALKKSLIFESEIIFKDAFLLNSSYRFRSEAGFNITNGLLQYDWLHRDKARVGQISNIMISLRSFKNQDANIASFQKIKDKEPLTFCIEDVTKEYRKETVELLHNFLEEKYPDPAPWEE